MFGKKDFLELWQRPEALQNLTIITFFIASPWLLLILLNGLGLEAAALFHRGLHGLIVFLFLVTFLLQIAAIGYFYRTAELSMSGSEETIPSWEDPVQYFRLGKVPLCLLAGAFSPSITLGLLGLLPLHFINLFWGIFFLLLSFVFFFFSIAIFPVVVFRMIEGQEYAWAFDLKEIIEDLKAMKVAYTQTMLSAFVLFFFIQMLLFILGAILCLTPIGIYVGGVLVVLVSAFFISSLLFLLIPLLASLFVSLPYKKDFVPAERRKSGM